MRGFKRGSIYTLFVIAVFFLVSSAFGAGSSSSRQMLPDGLVIEESYTRGIGRSVGRVLLVQGRVVIMHADMLRGYWAKKDLPLFKGDIIVTQERGRIRLRLKDDSILTLASKTNLVVNESVYNKKKKSRFSFLKMSLGKARFFVKKLANLRRSDFKVKTPTAVVGVRGSDFIIESEPERTDVTTLEDTQLEVVSLAAPEAPPTKLDDFEKTTIEEGELPTDPEDVTPEEIEEDLKDLTVTSGPGEPEVKEEVVEKEEEKKEPAKEPGAPPAEPAAEQEVAEPEVEEGAVLVPEEELVEPVVEPEEMAEIEEPDIDDVVDPASQQEDAQEQQEDVQQTVIEEETVVQELPYFPGTPGS
ncbi:FecR domain-containing protein [Thermodesulfobacteriota bacterium]